MEYYSAVKTNDTCNNLGEFSENYRVKKPINKIT